MVFQWSMTHFREGQCNCSTEDLSQDPGLENLNVGGVLDALGTTIAEDVLSPTYDQNHGLALPIASRQDV